MKKLSDSKKNFLIRLVQELYELGDRIPEDSGCFVMAFNKVLLDLMEMEIADTDSETIALEPQFIDAENLLDVALFMIKTYNEAIGIEEVGAKCVELDEEDNKGPLTFEGDYGPP